MLPVMPEIERALGETADISRQRSKGNPCRQRPTNGYKTFIIMRQGNATIAFACRGAEKKKLNEPKRRHVQTCNRIL